MKLSARQEKISQIVQEFGPITGDAIAQRLSVTRAALRSDLAVLTMMGILDARPKVGYFYLGAPVDNTLALSLRSYNISDILSQAIVVTPTTSLYDTIVMMFTEDVGSLLVCEDGYLQGIVSRKDLLRASLGHNDTSSMPISMIMTPASKVINVALTDHAVDAAYKMIKYEVDCLPVVKVEIVNQKELYKVIGRVSKTSITKLFLECCREHKVRGV